MNEENPNVIRQRAKAIAKEFLQKGDYTGWFERLYAEAEGDSRWIPWAHASVNPDYADWLAREAVRGEGKKAVVIGCGLGDEAEATARAGFETTAFDISASAIAWCRERFLRSPVDYCVADLLQLPDAWTRRFDFVLEIYTLPNFPESHRLDVMRRIAGLLAPGGTLLVITSGRDDGAPLANIPWPLSHQELNHFVKLGLREISFEDFPNPHEPVPRVFRVAYRAPLD